MLLYVLRTVGLLGTGAQDGHLSFHTAPELCVLRREGSLFVLWRQHSDCHVQRVMQK